jgi:hypothetical protein
VQALVGMGALVAAWVLQFYNSVSSALLITMVFVFLRLLVRRTWLAVVIGLIVVSAAAGNNLPAGGVGWLDAIAQVMAIGLITIGIFRYGLLVTAVMMFVDNIPTAIPIVSGGPSWAAMAGNLSIALVLAIACFGFYAARAGEPIIGMSELVNG